MKNSIHYSYRTVDGYQSPINLIIGTRGLGKTFGKVLASLRLFNHNGKRFIYVVQTEEDVKKLSQNAGEKFFSAIKEYLEKQYSKRAKHLYEGLFQGKKAEVEEDSEVLEGVRKQRIQGGTIKIGEDTAGYIIALNSFGSIKRNNFTNVYNIIFDEFIPEQIDIRHLQQPYKFVSIIQSIARTQNVRIWLLGNAIRLDDILLVRFGFANMKLGEIRTIKDEKGILALCHYVDPKEYSAFIEKSANSTAGRLAKLLKEDNLDTNTFKGSVPQELEIPKNPKSTSLLACIHFENESIRINVTKDYQEYYITSDYGHNKTKRYCIDPKYQSNTIQYNKYLKDMLLSKYTAGQCLFESSVIYTLFKLILGLE